MGDSGEVRRAASSFSFPSSTDSNSSSEAETSSSFGSTPAARQVLEKPSGSATDSGRAFGGGRGASPASPVRRSAVRAARSTSRREEEEVVTSAGGVLRGGEREREKGGDEKR